MGESCLEPFQDAQDCLLLTLADAADGDLFELGPDLLDLGAQGSTGSGGFDEECALVTGDGGAPDEPGLLEAPDRSGHGGCVGVDQADEVGLALGTEFPQVHHNQFLTRVPPDPTTQIAG